MKTEHFIAKDRKLLPSQDYEFLRKLGIKYIEKYGNKLWSDYNPHDPGITILEVLSYAITELGYRTNFDIKDLLANEEGDINNKTFFPANTIFTNAPVTEIDYRKILIDIEGIFNAWFLATTKNKETNGFLKPNLIDELVSNEKNIFLNKFDDKLTLQNKNSKGETLTDLITIRGFNKVVLELEDDSVLGDLNSTTIDFEFFKDEKWIQVSIIPEFESWNDRKATFFDFIEPNAIQLGSNNIVLENSIILNFESNNYSVSLTVKPYDLSEIGQVTAYFLSAVTDDSINNLIEVVKLYKRKREKVKGIYENVLNKLNENRNLTEDFISIETIKSTQIGICAKIEIDPQGNVVDVMAQIQMAIYDVINPPIKFYTLAQMLDQGYRTEDIFIGPTLDRGFLKDEEVFKTQLPKAIHASDIIAAVMKLKNVISINEVLLTEYGNDGKAIEKNSNKSWCLKLSGQQNPIFSTKKSRLQLYKKNIPFLLSEANQMIVDQKIQVFKSLQSIHKLKKSELDFPFPIGKFYQLDEFYSIQDEFPINYGIGKNKLSEKVTEKRKAQVKQLKGYLHFYDQILADFFSQLYNAKNILDTTTIQNTYFPNYLNKNPVNGEDFYSRELYAPDLESNLKASNNYNISLQENKSVFYDRRNRALDHLIARFGESFNDYVFMMYQVKQETNSLGELSLEYEEIIQDKQNFINQYPELSSKRGLGINYLNKENVASDNSKFNLNYLDVSGLGGYEKRVAKLLGINGLSIDSFTIQMLNEKKIKTNINSEFVRYKINSFNSDLVANRNWVIQNVKVKSAYKVILFEDRYCIFLVKSNKQIAKLNISFKTKQEADQGLTDLLNTVNDETEKFFCLEHILLRPFKNFDNDNEEDILLPVCLNDDCDDPASDDPYSFKSTIVLPGYLERFKNMTFRKYAEKIFRQEAPAHVLLKICWVNKLDMTEFHLAYRNWYDTYSSYRKSPNQDLVTIESHVINHKALIKKLKNLHTTYPQGNLYDCQLSEISNPIILGNTALGTF